MAFGNRQSSGLPLEGGTMSGAINMGTNNITNAGDISAAQANGYILRNLDGTAQATMSPVRAASTSGLAGGGANVTIYRVGSLIGNFSGGDHRFGAQYDFASLNGAMLSPMVSATSLLTSLAGATVSATNLIPAGSMVWGVVLRVTTLITASGGGTSFTVGDGTTANLWGNAIAFTQGTTTTPASFLSGTFAAGRLYTAATSVVLTVNAGAFTAGDVRLRLYYSTITAPTS